MVGETGVWVDRLLSIGELSERADVAPSALRFYEDRGLIRSTPTGGGQRRYRREVLRRVSFIRIAQRVGLGLDQIGDARASPAASRTPRRPTGRRCPVDGVRNPTTTSPCRSDCVTS